MKETKMYCFKLLSLLILLSTFSIYAAAQKQKVWVDADTGNETDDIYALARLIAEPSIKVVGVSSAHFSNAGLVAFEKWNQYKSRDINTVHISQQLNEELLKVMGKLSFPHPLVADRQMGRAWGGREPSNSDAAKEIIAAVKRLKKNEKLCVLSQCALTNIASFIAPDTSIAKHIVCYAVGANYNVSKGYWKKVNLISATI